MVSTRDEAVEWARHVRAGRDALVERVGRGECDLPSAVAAAAVADDREGTSGLRVVALADALPGVGKVDARRALRGLGWDPHRPIGSLDSDEVEALSEALR